MAVLPESSLCFYVVEVSLRVTLSWFIIVIFPKMLGITHSCRGERQQEVRDAVACRSFVDVAKVLARDRK